MDFITILLVDDEKTLLEASQLYLENLSEKFKIQSINSAKEALEKIKSKTFDIIISDYQMPEMDGLEFLSTLRSQGNDTPFIIFTGKGREEVAIQALNLGADFYLQKGGDTKSQFRELVNLIEKLVEKKQTDLARKHLLEQQISVNQLALSLGETRDLNKIYKTVFQYIYAIMDADTFVVDFYDKENKTISHGYTLIEGNVLDIMMFPPIPLGHRESEIQTKVIETGELIYKSDFYTNITTEEDPVSMVKDGVAKSAVYVPMKIAGEIIGVLQVQSYRQDAYSKADIELLSAMANVAAVSIQNARLFSNQYQMTQNIREEKDRTQKYLNLADALIIALDFNGNVVMINKTGCEILERTEEEVIGKNWHESFIPENDRSRTSTRFKGLMNGDIEPLTTVTNSIIRKSGEERLIRWKTDILRDHQNRISGILSSGIDITTELTTQEALKIYQTRYQRLLDNIDDGVIVFEKQELVFINDRAIEIYGYPKEELGKFNILSICAPEEVPRLTEVLRAQREEDNSLPENIEYWTITKSGERKFVTNRVYTAFDKGQIVNIFIFISDKTNEVLAENALRVSEENYRSTLNSMGVPIHVADINLRIVLANQSLLDWIESFGIDTDIIGKKISEVFPFLPATVWDEYRETFKTKSIVTSVDESYADSFAVMTETRKIPVIENGKVVRIITIIRDITEQKEMELQLRENEENTRRLFDNLSDGIILFDFQGTIVDTNERSSELLGYPKEELLNMKFSRFISKKDEMNFGIYYKKIIETGNANFTLNLNKKDKTLVLSEISASLIELVGKQHIQVIFKDISQQVMLEEEKEKRINDLMFLSQSAVNFVSIPLNENIYEYISLKIRDIVGESIVVTLSYDSIADVFAVKATIGLANLDNKKITLIDPIGLRIKAKSAVLDFIKKNPVGKFNLSLCELSNGLIPEDLEEEIRNQYNVKDVYNVSFTHTGKLFGAVIILPTKKVNLLTNRELLTAFANQTAVALLRRKAEEDLHESEEQYRALFKDSNDGIIIFNHKLDIVNINQKAEEMLLYKKEALLNKSIKQIIPKSTHKRFEEQINSLQTEKFAKFDIELRNCLEKTFSVEISANCIEIGYQQLFQIIFRDVTQKKIIEEIRTRHIDTLRFISSSAMDFVGLPPEKNVYQFIGEKVNELAGDSIVVVSSFDKENDRFVASAVLGISKYLVSLANILGQNPEKMSVNIDEKYVNLLSAGKLVKLPCTLDELTSTISKKQSNILWKLMNLGDMHSLVFVEDGKLFGTILVVMKKGKQIQNLELIEAFCSQASVALLRKITEEELQESEERFKDLVETMNDGFGMDDENGILTYINVKFSEMLGYSQEELLGKKAFEFLDPSSHELYLKENSDRKEGFYRPYEVNWKRKDGRLIPTIVSPKAILDPYGKFLGTYAAITDISERKAVEMKLKEQQMELQKQRDELESFASTIAHDLRGKMQIISLYNSLAEGEYSHKINESIEEMSDFIEDLLLLAKKGEILGEKVKVDLGKLVLGIISKISSLKPELEINVVNLPIIMGDSVKLGQVFENLIMNVVKHSDATKLDIYHEKGKDEHCIIIRDNGKGISHSKKQEIIESWSTKRYSSFGMLIIVKVVHAHDGHITLESEEGKGTKITLHFPKK